MALNLSHVGLGVWVGATVQKQLNDFRESERCSEHERRRAILHQQEVSANSLSFNISAKAGLPGSTNCARASPGGRSATHFFLSSSSRMLRRPAASTLLERCRQQVREASSKGWLRQPTRAPAAVGLARAGQVHGLPGVCRLRHHEQLSRSKCFAVRQSPRGCGLPDHIARHLRCARGLLLSR